MILCLQLNAVIVVSHIHIRCVSCINAKGMKVCRMWTFYLLWFTSSCLVVITCISCSCQRGWGFLCICVSVCLHQDASWWGQGLNPLLKLPLFIWFLAPRRVGATSLSDRLGDFCSCLPLKHSRISCIETSKYRKIVERPGYHTALPKPPCWLGGD